MSDAIAAPVSGSIEALVVEIRYLRRDVEALTTKLEATEKKVSEMQALVSKYRGGLAVILGAGGFIGWLLSNLSTGVKLWH